MSAADLNIYLGDKWQIIFIIGLTCVFPRQNIIITLPFIRLLCLFLFATDPMNVAYLGSHYVDCNVKVQAAGLIYKSGSLLADGNGEVWSTKI